MNLAHSWNTVSLSRIVLLAKTGLLYKVEKELMDDDEIASIWVTVGGRGRKKVMIGGVYREHRLLKQANRLNSELPEKQLSRWKKIAKQWKSAEKNTVCTVIGDTNIDFMKWNDPDRGMKDLTNIMKDEVETMGFVQMVEKPTRFWLQTADFLVDQIWSNRVDRISEVVNIT